MRPPVTEDGRSCCSGSRPGRACVERVRSLLEPCSWRAGPRARPAASATGCSAASMAANCAFRRFSLAARRCPLRHLVARSRVPGRRRARRAPSMHVAELARSSVSRSWRSRRCRRCRAVAADGLGVGVERVGRAWSRRSSSGRPCASVGPTPPVARRSRCRCRRRSSMPGVADRESSLIALRSVRQHRAQRRCRRRARPTPASSALVGVLDALLGQLRARGVDDGVVGVDEGLDLRP